MSRPTRIDFPGALFPVLDRGNQQRRNFPEVASHSQDEILQTRHPQRDGIHPVASVLMPNRIHLLLETERCSSGRRNDGFPAT